MTVVKASLLLAAIALCSGCGSDKDSCLRFGGGSCCPALNAVNRDILEIAPGQPVYAVFFPKNDFSTTVDNDCFTFFPVADDSETFILYFSRVFVDNSVEVKSFVTSRVENGVFRTGDGICQFTDLTFSSVDCERPIYLNQRCPVFGDCPALRLAGVFGISTVRQPISIACLNQAKAAISNNGLPDDDLYILPMRLPSQCILNQVCTVSSTLQRFCQTVGVAFPAINTCNNLYY